MEIDLFNNTFKGKKIVLTGCTGFKGSWLALWLKELGAEVFGYSLAPLHKEDNYNTTQLNSKIHSEYADILEAEKLTAFFKKHQPDMAFHLAAQPLVLSSYDDPAYTFSVNVQGTVHFLDAVRNTLSCKVAIVVTSDKCYDNKEWWWGYRENDAMGGNDPYSASKGCAELVTNSYIKSFFQTNTSCSIASVRAGNVIGGGDWSEYRIVPDFFKAVQKKESLVIRNPHAIRPWQFVLDPLGGYLKLAETLWHHSKKFSGGWNFGPTHTHYTVGNLVHSLSEKAGLSKDFVKIDTSEQKHEAGLLKLDISKAVHLLKWQPALDFEKTIQFTFESYQNTSYADRIEQLKKFTRLAHYNH